MRSLSAKSRGAAVAAVLASSILLFAVFCSVSASALDDGMSSMNDDDPSSWGFGDLVGSMSAEASGASSGSAPDTFGELTKSGSRGNSNDLSVDSSLDLDEAGSGQGGSHSGTAKPAEGTHKATKAKKDVGDALDSSDAGSGSGGVDDTFKEFDSDDGKYDSDVARDPDSENKEDKDNDFLASFKDTGILSKVKLSDEERKTWGNLKDSDEPTKANASSSSSEAQDAASIMGKIGSGVVNSKDVAQLAASLNVTLPSVSQAAPAAAATNATSRSMTKKLVAMSTADLGEAKHEGAAHARKDAAPVVRSGDDSGADADADADDAAQNHIDGNTYTRHMFNNAAGKIHHVLDTMAVPDVAMDTLKPPHRASEDSVNQKWKMFAKEHSSEMAENAGSGGGDVEASGLEDLPAPINIGTQVGADDVVSNGNTAMAYEGEEGEVNKVPPHVSKLVFFVGAVAEPFTLDRSFTQIEPANPQEVKAEVLLPQDQVVIQRGKEFPLTLNITCINAEEAAKTAVKVVVGNSDGQSAVFHLQKVCSPDFRTIVITTAGGKTGDVVRGGRAMPSWGVPDTATPHIVDNAATKSEFVVSTSSGNTQAQLTDVSADCGVVTSLQDSKSAAEANSKCQCKLSVDLVPDDALVDATHNPKLVVSYKDCHHEKNLPTKELVTVGLKFTDGAIVHFRYYKAVVPSAVQPLPATQNVNDGASVLNIIDNGTHNVSALSAADSPQAEISAADDTATEGSDAEVAAEAAAAAGQTSTASTAGIAVRGAARGDQVGREELQRLQKEEVQNGIAAIGTAAGTGADSAASTLSGSAAGSAAGSTHVASAAVATTNSTASLSEIAPSDVEGNAKDRINKILSVEVDTKKADSLADDANTDAESSADADNDAADLAKASAGVVGAVDSTGRITATTASEASTAPKAADASEVAKPSGTPTADATSTPTAKAGDVASAAVSDPVAVPVGQTLPHDAAAPTAPSTPTAEEAEQIVPAPGAAPKAAPAPKSSAKLVKAADIGGVRKTSAAPAPTTQSANAQHYLAETKALTSTPVDPAVAASAAGPAVTLPKPAVAGDVDTKAPPAAKQAAPAPAIRSFFNSAAAAPAPAAADAAPKKAASDATNHDLAEITAKKDAPPAGSKNAKVPTAPAATKAAAPKPAAAKPAAAQAKPAEHLVKDTTAQSDVVLHVTAPITATAVHAANSVAGQAAKDENMDEPVALSSTAPVNIGTSNGGSQVVKDGVTQTGWGIYNTEPTMTVGLHTTSTFYISTPSTYYLAKVSAECSADKYGRHVCSAGASVGNGGTGTVTAGGYRTITVSYDCDHTQTMLDNEERVSTITVSVEGTNGLVEYRYKKTCPKWNMNDFWHAITEGVVISFVLILIAICALAMVATAIKPCFFCVDILKLHQCMGPWSHKFFRIKGKVEGDLEHGHYELDHGHPDYDEYAEKHGHHDANHDTHHEKAHHDKSKHKR